VSDSLRDDFRRLKTGVEFFSLRYVCESEEVLSVRHGVCEPPKWAHDRGVMISVIDRGGSGYAATSDLSLPGLQRALDEANVFAQATRGRLAMDLQRVAQPQCQGQYAPPPGQDMVTMSLRERYELLAEESANCKIDPRIIDWATSLWTTHREQRYLSSAGGDIRQEFRFVVPNVMVTANDGLVTQMRSLAGQYNGYCRQGGAEVINAAGFIGSGAVVADEALQLLMAPDCPIGTMDVLLMPDQMMLQVHESIGHPLELDRILGDERNFAGASFVTLDMFGSFQYGSALLNVTYDPSRAEQFASYAFDDEGLKAEKAYVIRNGILERPLGGGISQARAGLWGVATSRASSWNRAPIDRMANLNVEPGASSLEEMISSTERGVLMKTNRSWSIDDSRNKFQFGCEWGQLIEHGELTRVVKNSNYRGISASFWRALRMVGDEDTFEIMGTPFCGKGEPSQIVRVGHASPACLFSNVDVFGGDG